MISYTDLSCPVCHQPFKADDDVVVCPVCGAPHHRECYRKEGHCAYADTHGHRGAVAASRTTGARAG